MMHVCELGRARGRPASAPITARFSTKPSPAQLDPGVVCGTGELERLAEGQPCSAEGEADCAQPEASLALRARLAEGRRAGAFGRREAHRG